MSESSYSSPIQPPQVKLTYQKNRVLGLRAQQVIDSMFAHPEWNQKQIAKSIGISDGRVSKILRSDRALAVLPFIAKRRIRSLIPKATKRYDQMMSQNVNLEVARKVATSVLESEKVLEPSPMLQVNVLAALTDDELRSKINKSVELPSKSIETDLA